MDLVECDVKEGPDVWMLRQYTSKFLAFIKIDTCHPEATRSEPANGARVDATI